MAHQPTMLLIDPREGSGDLLAPLARVFPGARLEMLESADVAWIGNGPDGPIWCGVEVKRTLSDIRDSVISGRLYGEQVPRLLRRYQWGALLIGARAGKHGGNWDDSTLVAQCTSFSAVTGWPAMWLGGGDPDMIAALIGMIRWWSKPWSEHGSQLAIKAPMIQHPGLATQTERIFAQIDGVGPQRARDLAEAFETPIMAAMAGVEGIAKIPGIGKATARAVVEAILGKQEETNA